MTSPAMAKVAADILAKPAAYGTLYVHSADTAKLVRATLAAKFPGTKFWVRSNSFAGGSSVSVYYDGIVGWLDRNDPPFAYTWQDRAIYRDGAPKLADVKAVVDAFGGADFDGSIDMSFSHDAYLNRDGTVTYGGTRGTSDSLGMVSPSTPPLPAGATKVHFLSYFHVSAEKPYGAK